MVDGASDGSLRDAPGLGDRTRHAATGGLRDGDLGRVRGADRGQDSVPRLLRQGEVHGALRAPRKVSLVVDIGRRDVHVLRVRRAAAELHRRRHQAPRKHRPVVRVQPGEARVRGAAALQARLLGRRDSPRVLGDGARGAAAGASRSGARGIAADRPAGTAAASSSVVPGKDHAPAAAAAEGEGTVVAAVVARAAPSLILGAETGPAWTSARKRDHGHQHRRRRSGRRPTHGTPYPHTCVLSAFRPSVT